MSTLLRWHLGLGDALVCNGMVRVLSRSNDSIVVPCWEHNLHSVQAMFADLPNVDTMVVEDDKYENPCKKEICLGFYGKDFDRNLWDRSFYRQAGLPQTMQWSAFDIPEGLKVEPVPIECFIHDDPARGFVIRKTGFRPDKRRLTVFDYLPELMGAKEVHCIDSCFAILADLMGAPGELWSHQYCRDGAPPTYARKWAILK